MTSGQLIKISSVIKSRNPAPFLEFMPGTLRIAFKMCLKISTFILAGFVVMGSSHEIEGMDGPWEKDFRIPKDIIPVSYNLFMDPNIKAGNFKGEVTALVNITAPRNWIPIHIKNLNISKTVVTDKAGKTVKVLETFKYLPHQFWVIKTDEIKPGLYSLCLNFAGSLTESITGFYRSQYRENGTTRSIATTKFEPVDARQAFPCFDEPALKAKFTIRVSRPKEGYSALSNMDVFKEEEGPGPDKVTVFFRETVPMSTYLVCFIVSDFVHSGEVYVDNVGKPFPLKIYSSPAQVANTLFARKMAAAVTKYYIDYFGIVYPLPKLDLIAIPDFVSGAMENWGLITFRETALLYSEKEHSVVSKQKVAVIVAHEISHQWFGNLVTMKWWEDLWLNEGFASFMQYKGIEEGIPECKDWQVMDYAIYDQIYPVLKKDSLMSSHPIIQPVANPNQITEIFDFISYNKGHAVIKMLEGFVGENSFKIGIHKYMKNLEFSSASTVDLWNILGKEIHKSINVSEIMDTWTRQMGYPLITVEKTTDSWLLKQTRFLTDSGVAGENVESPYKYKWDIPVSYVNDSSEPGFLWLKRTQKAAKIPRGSTSGYVKINHKQVGFYRVNYPTETWRVFENILKSSIEIFDRKDRANLLDDAFNLAEAGIIDYGIPLDLVGYLKHEKEFLPWAVGCTNLNEIYDHLYMTALNTGFRNFVSSLLKEKYGRKKGQFNFNVSPNDTHINRIFRVKFLELACKIGYHNCLQEAGEKFLEWLKKAHSPNLHPDIRALVLQYGMIAVGREAEWNAVWERYLNETNPQEKMELLLCLSSIREPWIISNFLQMVKNETYVRSQDYFQALTYISMNPIGNPLLWVFYRNEWPYLVKRFSLYHRALGTFITVVTSGFSTQAEIDEMENFYKKYPDAGAGANARRIALERVRINKKWLEKGETSISKWLTKNNFL